MIPSVHQQAIFDFVQHGRGSAVIKAVAGSGKTTTIVEAAKLLPTSKSAAFVAFNKAIATELATRLPSHVRAQTLNGMGHGAWMRALGGKKVNLDTNKTRALIQAIVPELQQRVYSSALAKLVPLAKSVGIVPSAVRNAVPLTWDEPEHWLELIEHHDIPIEEGCSMSELIDFARAILTKSIEMALVGNIDFDDQLYMPVIMRAPFWQNDYLFVDEAQDVNKIQRAMLKRALKPGGRLIAVGDPSQAIYGFRGADSDAIDNIMKEFGAVTLPLSVSYRCPKSVVLMAQQFSPDIQAHKDAPEGLIDFVGGYDHTKFLPEDVIVCRNTAPLIQLAYRLIRNKVPCHVMGREIGAGLVALVDKMRSKTIDILLDRLSEYQARETAKFMAQGQEQKADALEDKIVTIRVFIEELGEAPGQRTVNALKLAIDSLFSDKNNTGAIRLMTIHKAKGLEAHRLFILEWGLLPSKWARQSWQQQQETNLQYVAVTRSKSELYFIQMDMFGRIANATS